MSDRLNSSFQNILLTLKKYNDQTFELLYVSSEIKQVISGKEKFFQETFFNRIFPTLETKVFEYLFKTLGNGDKFICPLIIGKDFFHLVQIEGYVIAQEDQSYLINALITPVQQENPGKFSWLMDPSNGIVYSGKNSGKPVQNITKWNSFLIEKFPFLELEKLTAFQESRSEEVLAVFPEHIYLSRKPLSNGFLLFQLEYFQSLPSEKESTSSFLESTKLRLIYYDYYPERAEIRWSGGLEEILGYPASFFEGLSKEGWKNLIHPEDRGIYKKGLSHSPSIVYRMLHRNGYYIFVQEEIKEYGKSKDQEKMILGIIRDISEIKEIEKDLLENKTMVEELTGVVPGMVYMLKTFPDLSHEFIFVSENIRQLAEIEPQELLEDEKKFMDLVHPEDIATLLQIDKESYEKGTKFECSFRIVTASGKTKWIYGASNRLEKYQQESIWAGIFIDITYTKDKEKESSINLRKYKSLFEENPLPIFQYDRDGFVLDINNSFLQKIDLDDPLKIIGKNIFDLIGDQPIKNAYLESFLKGYGFYEGPYISYFNNKLFYLRLTAKTMDDGNSFQAILEDISEQEYVHNILSHLTESTSRFSGQSFLDKLTAILSERFQMDHCFIAEVNEEITEAKIISYSKKGQKASNYSYSISQTPCLECLNSSSPIIYTKDVYKHFPNSKILVEGQISSYLGVPITDMENKRVGLLVLMDEKPLLSGTSISPVLTILADRIGSELDRMYYENKLVNSELLFRSIAENFPKGTVEVLDKKLTYIYAEGKEFKTSGMDPKKLIGTPHLSKYESFVSNEVREYLDKILNGESVMFEVIIGNQYYLKSGVPLMDKSGEIDRILLVTQNITETKIAEEEREQLIRDLKSQNEELQRFAYIISHNLRAPIVNISSLLELYDEEKSVDPDNKEIIDNLKISTSILNSTLQDLIDVVSIKKNKLPKIEKVDFLLLCHNIEMSLHKQIRESGALIQKDFSKVPNISYIYSHLENFLTNLTTNAIKYKHPDRKPVINIRSEEEGGFTVIHFEDNGIGLDLDRYGERLFGLYQRFHSHVEGKGLGLYLVREQIRSHDGNLKVRSQVGVGTTFSIYLNQLKSNIEDLKKGKSNPHN
ncbi:hypothetical protein P872_03495 [Rhodonellum psychrophilum GCM71 = DSM 17998]|uniref:histidine kinase n=2 Tax=Rhodonellum TaxID=336827 RepID=U5C5J0_9BACT|nr:MULTISPECIES: PAS domain-containing sensor histidine kinase [Rhodonellum]ERM83457.1 hypothetical protein P872_03495 [Rhodonellum psychrophilum GCM71 = DSM 17998]MDO9552625.1 PAS domain S-box protein [Rhodonellum sp.]SDY43908.1 PAS domain S-box-containing protein [Rhodonellum ikkaensis]